jgi:protein tyrosine phosphatase (PTP) superfamily phosphohydrolase (DUF442 family)
MAKERLSFWLLIGLLATTFVVAPFSYYRWHYERNRRLRVVTPGLVYRSGQMTQAGFAEAFERYRIRTVINFQNEAPDPQLAPDLCESEFCRRHGVRYLFLAPDLVDRRTVPPNRPAVIDQFLAVMDDPENYPVLFHCRAGLHRTGVLAAVYRMEYQGWTVPQAMAELRAHGFGKTQSTARNDYITQYILTYQPRSGAQESAMKSATRTKATAIQGPGTANHGP